MYRIYEPLKLNLGCGATLFPDWINVDISPTADIVADVTKNLPFKDSSVAFIYSEHLVGTAVQIRDGATPLARGAGSRGRDLDVEGVLQGTASRRRHENSDP